MFKNKNTKIKIQIVPSVINGCICFHIKYKKFGFWVSRKSKTRTDNGIKRLIKSYKDYESLNQAIKTIYGDNVEIIDWYG